MAAAASRSSSSGSRWRTGKRAPVANAALKGQDAGRGNFALPGGYCLHGAVLGGRAGADVATMPRPWPQTVTISNSRASRGPRSIPPVVRECTIAWLATQPFAEPTKAQLSGAHSNVSGERSPARRPCGQVVMADGHTLAGCQPLQGPLPRFSCQTQT